MKKQHNNINLFDKDFRKQLRDNPSDAIKTNIDTVNDVEYKVVTNSKYITYFVMPDHSSYQELDKIQAGTKLSTAGSVGTVGSVGTASSSMSLGSLSTTVASVSTLGSASSAGTVGTVSTAKS